MRENLLEKKIEERISESLGNSSVRNYKMDPNNRASAQAYYEKNSRKISERKTRASIIEKSTKNIWAKIFLKSKLKIKDFIAFSEAPGNSFVKKKDRQVTFYMALDKHILKQLRVKNSQKIFNEILQNNSWRKFLSSIFFSLFFRVFFSN